MDAEEGVPMAEAASPARDRMTRERPAIRRLSRLARPDWRAIRATAIIAAAVVLLEVAGFAVWTIYQHRRTGRIELSNDGPPLVVQVLDESGQGPIGEPIDLVQRSTLALPDGDYRLRVEGVGRLGQTYRFAVNAGETIGHALSLDEGRLLGGEPGAMSSPGEKPWEAPLPFARLTFALELTPGGADLIECGTEGIVRRDGPTGKAVWDTSRPRFPYEPGRDPGRWLRDLLGRPTELGLVEPPPDLDRDGTRDLLLTLIGSPAFLAVSGRDGSMLWNHAADLDGPGGPQPEGPDLPGPFRPGVVIGAPALGDVDGDGTSDLIALVVFGEFPAEFAGRQPRTPSKAAGNPGKPFRRKVVAISGRTGRSLWEHTLDPAWNFDRSAHPTPDQACQLVRGRRSAIVGIVDRTRWLGLSPATGRPAVPPLDLGCVPQRPVQHADLDGDGEPELLVLGPAKNGSQRQSLSAFSFSAGRRRWFGVIHAHYEPLQDLALPTEWPLLVDLDGDGRAEIIVPHNSPSTARGYSFRGVEVLDGLGRTRWVRPLQPGSQADDGPVYLAEAPDLDGDGTREIVAVSYFYGRDLLAPGSAGPTDPERVYIDALSGRDGHPLWFWHTEIAGGRFARIWAPQWWGLGPDGWPMLAVTLGGRYTLGDDANADSSHLDPPVTHVLEASTGREVHRVLGLSRTGVADLDGDGLADLWGEADGQLRAFRGEPPERWRALGSFKPAADVAPWSGESQRPGVDLDGDGIGDALIQHLRVPGAWGETTGSRTAIARSGRDGRLLWKTVLDPPRVWFERDHGESFELITAPGPEGDLDGDGTPDVLAAKFPMQPGLEEIKRVATLPVQALSGRTGRPLWSAGPLPLGFKAYGDSSIERVAVKRVEPNGPPDVFVRHSRPFHRPGLPASTQNLLESRLARLSGRDGRILWDIPLTDPVPANPVGRIGPSRFGDLDRDGSLDAAIVVQTEARAAPSFEVQVISLRDGLRLWSRRIEDLSNTFATEGPQLRIVDLDGDDRPEVLATEHPPAFPMLGFKLTALDGANGSLRWSWFHHEPEPNPSPAGWVIRSERSAGVKDSVAVAFHNGTDDTGVVVLDADGREGTRRAPAGGKPISLLEPADLDGDGREELLLAYDGRLHAWGGDLKELWSWPDPQETCEAIVPATPGRAGTVMLFPALGLDGASGQPIWAGLAPQHGIWTRYRPNLLDGGGSQGFPLVLSSGTGTTAVRSAVPTTPSGAFAAPRGRAAIAGSVRDDPRWTRPLPWTDVIWAILPVGLPVAVGLALINVVLPIAILWLATRRRPWSLRVLMALPVAAAAPLAMYMAAESLMPANTAPLAPGPPLIDGLGTLAGVPTIAYAVAVGWNVVRRRWKRLATIAGLTLAASAIIAGAWLRFDWQSMPAVDHYGWSGWYLVVIPAAYAVGVLIPIAWVLRRAYRWLRRPRRRETGSAGANPLR
jgi:hypothetical protein